MKLRPNTSMVYVVTYVDENEEPVITVFDNEENARLCFNHFEQIHQKVYIDHAPVYSVIYFG